MKPSPRFIVRFRTPACTVEQEFVTQRAARRWALTIPRGIHFVIYRVTHTVVDRGVGRKDWTGQLYTGEK